MPEQALNKAITMIRSGKREPARQILTQLLKQDPEHEQAWLWISKCFDEVERKKYCFERVLKINPNNPIALRALKSLERGDAPVPAAEAIQPAERADTAREHLVEAHPRRRRTGLINFLAGLAVVAIVAVAVWLGLNYLLPKNIPITHAQLKPHLTAIAVFCNPVEPTERATQYSYVMRCNGYSGDQRVQVSVDVYSQSDAQKVDLILAYVTQLKGEPSSEGMGEILSHIAALPYKNAKPSDASAWVQRNFPLLLSGVPGEDPMTQFGRVRFHLASLSETRKYLAIGEGQN